MAATISSPPSSHSIKLPELFGKETVLFGWQGLTLYMPRDWHLVAFTGDSLKGNVRIADDDGARLEAAWEQARGVPDVSRSVATLLDNIAKEAKRKKHAFEKVENPKLLSRAQREHSDKGQFTSFGWTGDRKEIVVHGWGAAWHCEKSGRVMVLHFLGRGTESPDRTRRLAGEILNSSSSHAQGGWQTWSVFDLQLEIPEEFKLVSAKLQTGRLELDWERVKAPDASAIFSPRQWGLKSEKLGLRRISAANIVLENESFGVWAARVATSMFKVFRFSKTEKEGGYLDGGLRFEGAVRDLRKQLRNRFFDLLTRRGTAPPQLDVWQDKGANKILVVASDLLPENLHVRQDVLDSIITQ